MGVSNSIVESIDSKTHIGCPGVLVISTEYTEKGEKFDERWYQIEADKITTFLIRIFSIKTIRCIAKNLEHYL